MKILIVGGAGYVGSQLVPYLIEKGYEIDVLDLLWFGNHLPSEVKVIQKDALTCQQQDLVGYDQIIFLAGLSNDPMAEYDPAKNFLYNLAAPGYLGYLAKQVGIKRFIYASSCSVYGFVPEICTEETPPTCTYPYGVSKYQSEKALLALADKDFSVIILRKGTIGGYSPRMRFDLIVNTMYKSVMLDNRIDIHNPILCRPLLDIRDAIEAYRLAIETNIQCDIFNIASCNQTIKEIGTEIKSIMETLQSKKIHLKTHNWQDLRSYTVSIKKAEKELEFKPKYSIKDTIFFLHNYNEKYEDYSNKNFYNIKVFKELS